MLVALVEVALNEGRRRVVKRVEVASVTKFPIPWTLNSDPGVVVAIPTLPSEVANNTVEVAVSRGKVSAVKIVEVAALAQFPTPCTLKSVPGVLVPRPTLPSNWALPFTVRTLETVTLLPIDVASTDPPTASIMPITNTAISTKGLFL